MEGWQQYGSIERTRVKEKSKGLEGGFWGIWSVVWGWTDSRR